MSNTTKDFIDSIQAASKERTSAYDTTATVKRVEGNTAWVHIPGGVDETPVKLTISAKEGDQVQVRVSGGSAFMVGNGTNPPTDDTTAEEAKGIANQAAAEAGRAKAAADVAESYAQDAKQTADAVHDIAVQASEDAAEAKSSATAASSAAAAAASAAATADAKAVAAGNAASAAQTSANNALTSAQSAQQSADSALVNLSTVQDVAGVLNWITAHGTMTLTSDVTVNPAHVYFVVDAGGDYVVGGTHYSIVSEPKDAELSTYYELTVDESVQNYVATHIVVDSEGLWIVPDAGGNKVLIAVGGAGHTYSTAGTYIIGKVNNVDTVFAKFTAGGATIRATNSIEIAHLGYGSGNNSSGGTSTAPYYTFGTRDADIGNYSVAEGYNTQASNYASHAEGDSTVANGVESHAEGCSTRAGGYASHAEGALTEAYGYCSHTQNYYTYANGDYQTAIGKLNEVDLNGDYAFIIGNGEMSAVSPGVIDHRSNALTVDWNGNVNIASGAKYKIGGTDLSASDVGAVPTSRTVNSKALSSDITLTASDVGAEPTLTNISESGGTYSGGIEDEKLLTTATITKWQNILS